MNIKVSPCGKKSKVITEQCLQWVASSKCISSLVDFNKPIQAFACCFSGYDELRSVNKDGFGTDIGSRINNSRQLTIEMDSGITVTRVITIYIDQLAREQDASIMIDKELTTFSKTSKHIVIFFSKNDGDVAFTVKPSDYVSSSSTVNDTAEIKRFRKSARTYLEFNHDVQSVTDALCKIFGIARGFISFSGRQGGIDFNHSSKVPFSSLINIAQLSRQGDPA